MRYNPDSQKYSEVKSDKEKVAPKGKGGQTDEQPQYDPGYMNFQGMMDQFFGFQPKSGDDEGRALKYSFLGNVLNKGFESQLAMGMGEFQAGLSKDMMNHASMVSQMEQSNARKEEFGYGMRSMDKQYELQNQFQNQEFNRNIGMLGATGEQTRKNYAAQGVENRLQTVTEGEQDRLNMSKADEIAAGKEKRQSARATAAARAF